MRGENLGHGCNPNNHEALEGEHTEEHHDGEVQPAAEKDGDHTTAGAPNEEPQLIDLECITQEVPQIDLSEA